MSRSEDEMVFWLFVSVALAYGERQHVLEPLMERISVSLGNSMDTLALTERLFEYDLLPVGPASDGIACRHLRVGR